MPHYKTTMLGNVTLSAWLWQTTMLGRVPLSAWLWQPTMLGRVTLSAWLWQNKWTQQNHSPLTACCKLPLLGTSEGNSHFTEKHIISHSRWIMPQHNPQLTEVHVLLLLQVVSVPIVVLAMAVWKLQQAYHLDCNILIQGVPGGKDLTSGECSLGQTIPI